MSIEWAAILVFLINLPFGYWRANESKFSRGWFLAIHLPVPIVIALRLLSDLGFHWATFPVMICAFFTGQLAGGKFHDLLGSRKGFRVTACLFRDLIKGH